MSALKIHFLTIITFLNCRVDEFAETFVNTIEKAKNGSVWMIDGGESKEIEYKNPWFDNQIKE